MYEHIFVRLVMCTLRFGLAAGIAAVLAMFDPTAFLIVGCLFTFPIALMSVVSTLTHDSAEMEGSYESNFSEPRKVNFIVRFERWLGEKLSDSFDFVHDGVTDFFDSIKSKFKRSSKKQEAIEAEVTKLEDNKDLLEKLEDKKEKAVVVEAVATTHVEKEKTEDKGLEKERK